MNNVELKVFELRLWKVKVWKEIMDNNAKSLKSWNCYLKWNRNNEKVAQGSFIMFVALIQTQFTKIIDCTSWTGRIPKVTVKRTWQVYTRWKLWYVRTTKIAKTIVRMSQGGKIYGWRELRPYQGSRLHKFRERVLYDVVSALSPQQPALNSAACWSNVFLPKTEQAPHLIMGSSGKVATVPTLWLSGWGFNPNSVFLGERQQ